MLRNAKLIQQVTRVTEGCQSRSDNSFFGKNTLAVYLGCNESVEGIDDWKRMAAKGEEATEIV